LRSLFFCCCIVVDEFDPIPLRIADARVTLIYIMMHHRQQTYPRVVVSQDINSLIYDGARN